MMRLLVPYADWPSPTVLLSTIAEVSVTGRWDQVGVAARDNRVVWTTAESGVWLFYEPAPPTTTSRRSG